jgi:hypothetical protein
MKKTHHRAPHVSPCDARKQKTFHPRKFLKSAFSTHSLFKNLRLPDGGLFPLSTHPIVSAG